MADEVLPLGHHEFIQRVQETSFEPLDSSGLLLRLCASVEVHPSEPPGPGRHRGATTLAIRMVQAAARTLFGQIRETFQRMGWPPPLGLTHEDALPLRTGRERIWRLAKSRRATHSRIPW